MQKTKMWIAMVALMEPLNTIGYTDEVWATMYMWTRTDNMN